MNDKLEHELYSIDPIFFEHAIKCVNGSETEMDTCMFWGCECGDGWFEPLKRFVQKTAIINKLAAEHNGKFVCDQLKEKFGEIRVYYSSKWIDENSKCDKDDNYLSILSDMFEDALKRVEDDCWNVCEWCGAEGGYNGENLVTTRGWISRICKKCAKEKAENETKKYDEFNKQKHIPRITWFHEGYEFLNPYHADGFKYNDNYYISIIEAFYCTKDKEHEKLYQEAVHLNERSSSNFVEVLAHTFNINIEDTENDYNLLKDIVKAKFNHDWNTDIKQELIETNGKRLQYMGNHHNNILGHCVCENCKDKEHKDLYAKILMEVREELLKKEKCNENT